MNIQFDNEFNTIEQLRFHPTYYPFVGDDYEDYRILQIGESHYLRQTSDNEKYNIEYFEKWWSNPCQEVLDDNYKSVNTRIVISNYMNDKGDGAYTIFTNFIKSFSKIVLKNSIDRITVEDKGLYRYVSFMNFFQMPSLYSGKKYWDSLLTSAKKLNKKQLAYDMWSVAVRKSIATVDDVIDIISPKAVVFTSISAGDAYKKWNGKYKDDSRVIYTSHPGYPFTWWKKLKSLDGKRGIDAFEDGLTRIYG